MITTLHIDHHTYTINLRRPIDISLGVDPSGLGVRCFYAPPPSSGPVIMGDFVGSVAAGSAVNFYWMKLIPHGQGTHTECVGHIMMTMDSVVDIDMDPFYLADLVTVYPEERSTDRVITADMLEPILLAATSAKVLILRTLPNDESKRTQDYSGKNPPYITSDAMHFINEKGYLHLVVDLPSVDREEDGGALAAHKAFWEFDTVVRHDKTITELVYVPDDVLDGRYVLQYELAPIRMDAVPSRLRLYELMRS